jgi:predicted homoserine dehydrogenase-like protein
VTAAKRDLEPGEVLDGLGHYMTYGLCENHDVVRADRLLPIGLAEGSVVTRAIRRDEVLTTADVEPPSGSLVHSLRAEQDRLFGS